MRLDPLSLKLFVSVVERGSISAAAERGNIAPAAVSKRMSDLEARLGTRLLIRTNKGAEPTAAGIALLNLARRLLTDLDDIAVQMREWSGGTRGQVRVFANISAITQFLPRQIASFLERYPQVDVQLQERISSAIVKAVIENEADVGICVLNAPTDGVEVFPYHEDELVLIVPKGHPLSGKRSVALADTLEFDFVGLHTDSSINLQLARASLEAQRSLRLRIQVTSYDALARMVEAGLGIGVMPGGLALPLTRSLGVTSVALADAWARRRLSICVRSYEALPAAARLLVDCLRPPEAQPKLDCKPLAIVGRDGALARNQFTAAACPAIISFCLAVLHARRNQDDRKPPDRPVTQCPRGRARRRDGSTHRRPLRGQDAG